MPKTACAIYDNFMNGNIKEAQLHQHKLNRFIDTIVGNNLSVWKSILSVMGIDAGYTVAPCIMPTEEKVNELIKRLESFGCTEEMLG